MSSVPDSDPREVLKKAYLEIRTLRSRLQERNDARTEPIAVIGMGCRFPGGANDAQSFWSLLHRGVDAVGEVPPDRWDTDALFDPDPDAPGKLYARHGSFLRDVGHFDAGLFGISPLEAGSMDPQQRLLLELAWEALEDAAIAPDSLRASSTGVFVGLMYQDYLARQMNEGGRDAIGPYLGTGSTFSAAAGRLSYALGLQGPSMAIDTACSSSLVAVHLACQALRNGECDVALAGGANVILNPEPSINLSKARMLSPTGRCRTFDASADGYVRGEGGGLIVLKRLSKALEDGDRIAGIVRGSAVNQDGRSNGLTAPNGSAQRALLRQALAAAGADAEDIEYVECHGTGTPLGDPIEVGALLDVYGERAAARPLAIGSVKTNFGHLESAAGICGLIKALLVLSHREVPPHLHFTRLNPHIRLDGKPVVIPTAPAPWFTGPQRMAAVSAFGFVGTNAHVILESFDAAAPGGAARRDTQLLTISAATDAAFRELRDRYVDHLEGTGDELADICFTANSGRAQMPYRCAVTASDVSEMKERLRAVEPSRAPAEAPRLAFLFTGQGSQSGGTGRRLYETEPLFRSAIDRCDAVLRPVLRIPLRELLFGEQSHLLEQTGYAQPALVALEYALFELWRSWGVRSSLSFGHSVGDYAVAICDGTFTLEEGLTLVAERGRLMQALPAGGGMAAVFASEAWGMDAVAAHADTLAVAAINAPSEIVLSGRLDHLRLVLDRARAEGLHARELAVSHAFHSPLMRPMLEPFGRVLEGVAGAERWLDHVLAPVRFADSIETLRERGVSIALELGPRAVLAPLASRTLGAAVTGLSSLQAGRDDVEQMLATAAALYTKGVAIDWRALDRPFSRRRVSLPTYAFQRERYWIKDTPQAAKPAVRPPQHLLGTLLPQAPHQPDTFVWEIDTDRARRPFLFGHELLGNAIWPIAAQMELARQAAHVVFGGDCCGISALEFHQTLHAIDEGTQQVQVVVTRTGESADFAVYSRTVGGSTWVLNTSARLDPTVERSTERPLELSMMFFAAKAEEGPEDRYRLIVEAARFADRNGFGSVWVPERHFTDMGNLYPSPAVLHAALARETSRVRLMAGSVVLPLHNVARIAEEWAMVDNLSAGRVGVSLAPGWNPDDFVLAAGRYEERYDDLYAGVETLRRLWRGEEFEGTAPGGRKVRLRTYPTPVQRELPIWITAARGAESFRRAGSLGANLLTHLLDQDVETLAEKIALYRAARAENGFDPEAGTVTVMCHTFVAPEMEMATRLAKKPFCDYLKSSMPLLAGLAYSRGTEVDINELSPQELDDFVEFLYERFSTTRALIGTPESCRALLSSLAAAGVNEVACLLDFGPQTEEVLEHLPLLASLTTGRSRGAADVPLARMEELRSRCSEPVDLDRFYAELAASGVSFERSLRSISSLTQGARETLAEIPRGVDPAVLLDACVQGALAALPRGAGQPLLVPVRVDRVSLHRLPVGRSWAHSRVSGVGPDGSVEGNIALYGEDGELLLEIGGLHVKAIERSERVSAEPGEEWFYEPVWRETEWVDLPRQTARPWMILEDHIGVGRAWAARRHGAAHLFVQMGAVTEQIGPAQWSVDPRRGFAQLLRQIDVAAYEGILCLWPLDATPSSTLDAVSLEADQGLGIDAVIGLMQALGSAERRNVPPLWLATSGAQAVASGDVVNVSQSTLWGLAGALAREHREWWGGIVDLDPDATSAQNAADLDRAISCGGEEDQVAVREGTRLLRRLTRTAVASARTAFREDSSYLITGGGGGLGLAVARWMAERGARHLVLLGRSSSPDIPSMPAGAVYTSVDVADAAALQNFLAQRTGPPIRGVVHAAGVFHDAPLRRLDHSALWDVLRSKVLGAWALHRALERVPLDFFVLFSSFSGLTPPVGQAAYAAASAFLDGLAHARRHDGLPALSIDWGAWSEIGFASTPFGRDAHARLEAGGMRRLTPEEGIWALDRLLGAGNALPQVAVFPADLHAMAAADPVLEHRPLLRELLGERAVMVPQAGADALLRIRRMNAQRQHDYLRERVAGIVAETLAIRPERLDLNAPLTQLGLDSLIAVRLKNRLEKEVGLTVSLVSMLRGASVVVTVDELMVELRLTAAGSEPREAGAHRELEL